MSVFTYLAKNRRLKSGHAAGTTYQIECGTTYPPFDTIDKAVNMALDGATEELLYHTKSFFDITVMSAVLAVSLDDWREFFLSVAAREIFQFDPTGTIAVPGPDNYDVVLVGGVPRPQLLDVSQIYRFSLTVELV